MVAALFGVIFILLSVFVEIQTGVIDTDTLGQLSEVLFNNYVIPLN